MLTDSLDFVFGGSGGVLTVAMQEPHVSLTQTKNVSECTSYGRPKANIRHNVVQCPAYLPVESTIVEKRTNKLIALDIISRRGSVVWESGWEQSRHTKNYYTIILSLF